MQALSMERDVSVRYVTKPSELGEPDVILLPGTKNTIQDLLWLRESGLEAKIYASGEEGHHRVRNLWRVSDAWRITHGPIADGECTW